MSPEDALMLSQAILFGLILIMVGLIIWNWLKL